MLENIKTPKDIKNLSNEQMKLLAEEIRGKIIDTVSKNGGHLGSNLGLVETTLMLHKYFDVPNDKIVFDVGHQCYTHKLLTGRYDRFDSLRTGDGISGFTNRFESEYDTLTAGHSGSSLSAALGIATANKLNGNDDYTVAVVGDGSFTNGMIYEALNNCNNKSVNFIIILNDNEMSISQNVGSLANYLSKIRTSGKYYSFKRSFQRVFGKIPVIGRSTINFSRHIKNAFKRLFYKQPFFEPLGVKYLGPVDGNDMERLQIVIEEAKKIKSCALVHIKTKKGYGYKYAEDCPENYHSVGAFDPDSGVNAANGTDFSAQFGKIICNHAEKNSRICAITAAMRDGTGLTSFSKEYPERFFDVGIAEEHEIAFAGGLALQGYVPVCAVYSTFAQRVYDQLIHDVSLQKLHIVLALDRAGLVPGDGETHQGIFDCSFISGIPSTEIYSPDSFDELEEAFELAVNSNIISVVRYPKGVPAEYDRSGFVSYGSFSVCDSFVREGKATLVLITYGSLTANVYSVAKKLSQEGKSVRIIKLFKVHPVKECAPDIERLIKDSSYVYFAEEGIKNGGVGQKLLSEISENGMFSGKMLIRAIDSFYPTHGSLNYVRKVCKLDEDSIYQEVCMFLNN